MTKLLLVFAFAVFLSVCINAQSLEGLHVVGNKIVNSQGQPVRLRGVDRSGTEFMCIQGYGIFDGPHDQASVDVIKSWNTNIIRLPLNEDCWLNINGVNPLYGGSNYQSAVQGFVSLLNSNGFAVILDLHWTAPGTNKATGQMAMPDLDHSPTFWSQVGAAYANNSMVIFDLFNEPFPYTTFDSTEAWTCWRDGNCPNLGFRAAGMQMLLDSVRNAGAKNLVIMGGLMWSNSLTQWMTYKPVDPVGNSIPSWHSYNFNECNNQGCWNSVIAPVAAKYPIIASEIGENDCGGGYITPLTNWMDSMGNMGYLAWTWNTWNCDNGPALISNYSGIATGYGAAYKAHLASL